MRYQLLATVIFLVSLPVFAAPGDNDAGFTPMFNGVDLTGWEGKQNAWRVEDGAITAQSTPEQPCERAHYLYWQGGEPADFILRFDYKLTGEGGNSGVQFRSEKRDDYDAWGYQADIESGKQWSGCIFQHDRGGVVMRGYKAKINAGGERTEESFAKSEDLQAKIIPDGWNSYEVRAQGNHIVLAINGNTMCEVWDDDAKFSRSKGFIALQMHPGPPMKIQFRNLRIKRLDK